MKGLCKPSQRDHGRGKTLLALDFFPVCALCPSYLLSQKKRFHLFGLPSWVSIIQFKLVWTWFMGKRVCQTLRAPTAIRSNTFLIICLGRTLCLRLQVSTLSQLWSGIGQSGKPTPARRAQGSKKPEPNSLNPQSLVKRPGLNPKPRTPNPKP